MTSFAAVLARTRMFLAFVALLAMAGSAAAAPAKAEPRPKPETYICPNVTTVGVDCFLDAVEHLYTMCKQVKHIELLEFGIEHAEEGVNGSKSEYCVDKHKGSMARPYQAALREASGSQAALEALRSLHDLWLQALAALRWNPPETDAEYQARVDQAYDTFHTSAEVIRSALVDQPKQTTRAASASPPARRAAGAKRRPN
ncbi:MAG: hypothetical protein M3Z31_04285 [Pseudomonadota bacterium]|nr:hypothetical protein [Pseudomonadota bacterium]